LTWTASSDNVAVTGYNIYRNGVKIGTSASTAFSNTGLAAATSYSFSVSAYDAAGNVSAVSAVVSATTMTGSSTGDTAAPSIPSNLKAVAVSASQINLTWTASSDNTAVTGYNIYRNGVLQGTVSTNSTANTGLVASTLYTYTVSAFDAAGNVSAQSASASATTLAISTPPSSNPGHHYGDDQNENKEHSNKHSEKKDKKVKSTENKGNSATHRNDSHKD
jgi:cellulose 1,4-beta-cellobiosidase